MNNLLDTHTFIWFIKDAKELSAKVKISYRSRRFSQLY